MKGKGELVAELQKHFEATGLVDNTVAEKLRELREITKAQGDPLVTKVLRLTAERIEANAAFELEIVPVLDEPDDEELDETYVPEEPEPETIDLGYLLSLIEKSDNKYNREELGYVRNALLGR